MTNSDRVGAWIFTAIIFLIGAGAVVAHRFPQGKGIYRVESLRGAPAVIFGVVLVMVAVYFACLLRQSAARDRKTREANRPSQ